MSVLPVAMSRVSEPLKNQRLLFQLNADQLSIQQLNEQLSTGRRVSRISDDPAAAGRAIILQRGIGRVEQLTRNAAVTESFYQSADDALNRIGDALIEARGTTVQAAQNVLSQDERNALAITVRQALENTIAAGNAIFRDHQLLGGVLENQQPLRIDGADVLFAGTDAVAKTSVGGGNLVATGVTGNAALGIAEAFFSSEPLTASLDRSTRLIDMRNGRGVAPGTLRISDGGDFVPVDLRGASTLGDVVDILNSLEFDGRRLQASIQPDGITLGFADGLPGTLAVDNAAGDTMANDLSIFNPLGLTPPPLVANGLGPRLTEFAALSGLRGGAGINLAGGLQIQVGEQTFAVDLTAARNIGDVLVSINRSGAAVHAELDSSNGSIRVRALRSGVSYGIGENGGTTAAELGLRTATGQTRLADLNHGRGFTHDTLAAEFSIVRPDGVRLDIELSGTETVQQVLDVIRNHRNNQDTLRVIPSLNPVGNGIQLLAPPGATPLRVLRSDASNAAEVLGLVAPGQTESTGAVVGSFALLNGSDFALREAGGAIDTLLRLENAIRKGDVEEIGRLQGMLDLDLDRAVETRGRVGVWSQNVSQLRESAEDQIVSLKSELSNEVDADLAEVVSQLQQRQTSLEASLRLIGQTARLTLLDFL